MTEPSSLLSTYHSLKQLKLSNIVLTPRKSLQTEVLTAINRRPQVDIARISKAPSLPLKIYEAPFDCLRIKKEDRHFAKIYHYLPDDFKVELNDLTNWRSDLESNLKVSPRKLDRYQDSAAMRHTDRNERKQTRSLVAMEMKRSWQSKPEDRSPYCHEKSAKRSEIYSHEGKQVVEVSKPLLFDCRSSSFYSSRTEEYESPVSKDSASTAECRMVKRSEMCRTPQ